MPIRFGTSGWRAVIADEFTFEGVRTVTMAICQQLRESGFDSGLLVVGHDTRFLGEQFAAACVRDARLNSFSSLLCEQPVPTPVISFAIRNNRAVGGINFTASHNPPEYSGMKFSTADGAPALPEITRRIERIIEVARNETDFQPGKRDSIAEIHSYDPRDAYLLDISTKIRFDVLKQSHGRYAYDPLWGTGRGYLDEILRRNGLQVETIHDWRDVTFGGESPEPSEAHLSELREVVLGNGCTLGLATDGDGDRFGVIDSNGRFITPNQLIAILFDYLVESRGWEGGVARSVATSHLVDRLAGQKMRPVFETPVGFKFIGEMINEDKIVIGGEESAGLTIKGHYPEKDGILACLLAAEAVAARGVSLSEQLEDVFRRVGRIESGRIGVRLTPELLSGLSEKLDRENTQIGGRKIEEVNRMDGVKYVFANESWLLIRPSGTEPMVRIYAESESADDLEVLLEQGRKYILGR